MGVKRIGMILLGTLIFLIVASNSVSASSDYNYRVEDPLAGTSIQDINTEFWEPSHNSKCGSGGYTIDENGFTLSGCLSYLGLIPQKWMFSGDFEISVFVENGNGGTPRGHFTVHELIDDCGTYGSRWYGLWGGGHAGPNRGDVHYMAGGESAHYLIKKVGDTLTIYRGDSTSVDESSEIVIQTTVSDPDGKFKIYVGVGWPNRNTFRMKDFTLETDNIESCTPGTEPPESWEIDNTCKGLLVSDGASFNTLYKNAIENAGLTAVLSSTVPQDMSEYNVVIVNSYSASNSVAAGYLENYLTNGGGVITTSGVAYYMGTPSWLGASRYTNRNYVNKYIAIDNPFGTDYMAGDLIGTYTCCGAAAMTGLFPTATPIAYWTGGASAGHSYEYNSGRVIWDNYGGNAPDLLDAGVEWAAGTCEEEDTTAPTTSADLIGTIGNNDWYVSNVEISLTATDEGSGVASTYFSLDGGAFVEGSSLIVTDEGEHTLAYYSVDNAGNEEEPKSVSFKIDKTAPEGNIDSPEAIEYEHSDTVSIDFTVADAVSGVLQSTVLLDGNVYESSEIDLLTLSLGTHVLTVESENNAGLVSTEESVEFEIVATIDSIISIKDRLYDLGEIDNKGIMTSLNKKLAATKKKIDSGQNKAATNILEAFIAEVEAQRGKHITDSAADILITDAEYVIGQL